MILTEMHHGQGLGNQLFCYITARTIAADKGVDFGLKGLENLGDRRYNDKGLYFMDLYLGEPIDESKTFKFYKEKELRLKTNASHHDSSIGCDISIIDNDLIQVDDDTHIEGIMQSEDYFYHRKDEIKHLYPDISKAKLLLNWQPNVSFSKGFNKTINYYRLKIKV
jgi:hypothetical protein